MDASNISISDSLTEGMLHKCMQNRELSWLKFNERVLEEAETPVNPLFERLSFLSIFTSNLDEFFMIRVGGLCDHAINKTGAVDNKTGMNAAEQLALIYEAAARLYASRDRVNRKLEAELEDIGTERLQTRFKAFDKKRQKPLDAYYAVHVQPLLAPQIIDASHPFPHLENKRQFIALSLESKNGKPVFGLIPVPGGSERIYFQTDSRYMLTEDIILHYSGEIFKNYKVNERAIICVTRNADIVAEEERFDEDEDFRDYMSKLMKKRRRLAPVRLEIRGDNCGKLAAYLQNKLSLSPSQTFYSESPLDMTHYVTLRDKMPPQFIQKYSFTPFEPAVAQYAAIHGETLRRLRYGDILLYHPYESIQPLFSLIRDAAEDKRVISIQITLYRIAERSKLVDHLITAAENGKDVVVFIELRARMDEEKNIDWARRMEEAGCKVFYGPAGFKLHAKICLITRRDGMKTEYVTHIGTGNYNETSSRLYTDISLMTVNQSVGRDALLFFNNLMIGVRDDADKYFLFIVAPESFKTELIKQVNNQARLGANGRIAIKCNSLTDRDVIISLIKASCAGVKIDLIIRGICCLTAQIPYLTENIRIISVVGRFLEHARIYRFGAAGDCVLYIGSGDMMTRNTERRVELFTPVLDPKNKRRLSDMLDIMLADNVKSREMHPDGRYAQAAHAVGSPAADSQSYFIEEAVKTSARDGNAANGAKRNPFEEALRFIKSLFRGK